MNPEFSIRSLTIEDIPAAMQLVLAEGWNQTEKDWELFIENPDNNCKGLVVDEQLVGTATSYRFSKNLAWVSMVLVNKNFRGRGFGKALLESVLNELKNCKSIKLDATPAGEMVYEKLGFSKEYSISRWVCDSFDKAIHLNPEIAEISKRNLKPVIEFDKAVFGVERPKLIHSLAEDFPDFSNVLKKDGKILGFSLGRKGNKYIQIGPVSATSDSTARELISSVLKDMNHQAVVVDVMDDKTVLANWLSQLGFQKKRQFCRMYLHDNSYPGKTDQQYLICGPEFG